MINVIGLGYIGLPTALMMASHGVEVVGTDGDRIIRKTSNLLDDEDEYKAMSRISNPYGDSHASERIAVKLGHILWVNFSRRTRNFEKRAVK